MIEVMIKEYNKGYTFDVTMVLSGNFSSVKIVLVETPPAEPKYPDLESVSSTITADSLGRRDLPNR